MIKVVFYQDSDGTCLGFKTKGHAGYAEAVADCVAMVMEYTPNPSEHLEKKYRRFCALYKAALAINEIK